MARRAITGLRGILTGASSGIGRALTIELVRDGAKLVAVARRADRLQELAAAVTGAPGELEMLVGDVTSPEVRVAAVRCAVERFGGLDLLVNNAGIGAMGQFARADEARLRQVMEVNFFAAAEMIRLAVPQLKLGRTPIVVNVSSVLGHRGAPDCAEYCASKFALAGLSESLRVELAPAGIDVLVVSPATTETEFFDVAIDARPKRVWWSKRGTSSENVARQIARAIEKGKRELVISAGGKALLWVSFLFPGIVDRVLARR
jgi:short-subunit dehydrogenase